MLSMHWSFAGSRFTLYLLCGSPERKSTMLMPIIYINVTNINSLNFDQPFKINYNQKIITRISAWEENEDEGTRIFPVVSSDRTRENRDILKYIKFHLNTRNFLIFFFTVRVVKHWPGCSEDCRVSIHRDVQNPAIHSPEKPSLADPRSSQEAPFNLRILWEDRMFMCCPFISPYLIPNTSCLNLLKTCAGYYVFEKVKLG